jgi:O-antigen/teichoic acid export membrane protein
MVGIAASWVLAIFGRSYAQEATSLLRLLALAAPLAIPAHLYITYLRVRKLTKCLVISTALMAILTLGTTALLMPRIGVAAGGLGWLLGNGSVAVVALATAARGGGVHEMGKLVGGIRNLMQGSESR